MVYQLNSLHPYLKDDLCLAIEAFTIGPQTTPEDKTLHLLHKERMHILKRIIKQGLDSVTRKIVEEAAVTHPAAIWTRIHNHCVVSTEHT